MEKVFKTLSNNKEVNLIDYIKEYKETYPDIEILIGCDSQNRITTKKIFKKETIYAVVIGLYHPGKGAHVVYSKIITSMEKESIVRLLNEVWFSVETAELIKNELGIKATWIDVDINADEKYKSNAALSSALGIVRGMGYNVRYKNSGTYTLPMVTYMCDHIVK